MPSFNPFSCVAGRATAALFNIRLDNETIFLRGADAEAPSQLLSGVVVLCLPQALEIQDVRLQMTGHLKLPYVHQHLSANKLATHMFDKTTEIFNHEWPPLINSGSDLAPKAITLPPGSYEWPFKVVINGSTAESIEGLPQSYLTYRLKATVVRGKLIRDWHAYKPVRVVRTLNPAALELVHDVRIENIWPNKVDYQIVIPQKAIVFGTSIPLDMRFTSLLKGLKFGKVKCILYESHEFTLPQTVGAEKLYKHTRSVEAWQFALSDHQDYQELSLNNNCQDGCFRRKVLPLPKNMGKCLQDADVHGIKIRHMVKVNLALHNPDGHVSELRATLPVTIFISPNMLPDSNGCIIDQTAQTAEPLGFVSHAPPIYGQHVQDQLYTEIGHAHLVSPASQSKNYMPYYSCSPGKLSEDSIHHDEAVEIDDVAILPKCLASKLQNLDAVSWNDKFATMQNAMSSERNTPHDEDGSCNNSHCALYSGIANSCASEAYGYNNGFSNMASIQCPQRVDYFDLSSLSRVPSYPTAVRGPIPSTNSQFRLPSYEAAVSATGSGGFTSGGRLKAAQINVRARMVHIQTV